MSLRDKKKTLEKPGVYLWEIPDKPVSIQLPFELIDRLLQDVMRGFGAVPKRGAEVGGILTGMTHTSRGHLTVEIEDYELVPIEYKRGPSYLLSAADHTAFEETFGRLRNGVRNGAYPIGMFRSNTRESVGLAQEDLELLGRFFPEPDKIFLMIRPFATKVSQAGFFFRENGSFQAGAPLGEFPFRRKDLGDDSPPAPPPVREGDGDRPIFRQAHAASAHEPTRERFRDASEESTASPIRERSLISLRNPDGSEHEGILAPDAPPKGRSGWVWLPLSFIFLLLGVLLGFQAAQTLRPQAGTGDPYSVGLTVMKDGSNLNVRWDRASLAIRTATGGVLVIEDGVYAKPVVLSRSDLQTGSVVYPPNSHKVRFRLELSFGERQMLFEKLEWKE